MQLYLINQVKQLQTKLNGGILNLTEEESALISEYAAGILIKHDKYAGKLASDAEIIAAVLVLFIISAETSE